MKTKLRLTFLGLILNSLLVAQGTLLSPELRDLLHEALSGERAKDHVIQITRHNRIQASRGYRNAAQYVLRQLRRSGFSDKNAFVESYPSDGKITYQTWQSPSGWDIDFAELRMVEPYIERIIGYPEIGMSLMTYSNPGDLTADLVWVGAGTSDEDYIDKDVKDKFVLATGYGGSVHRLAVLKYGAKAVICYLDDYRAKEFPDMLQYTGMWPRSEELKQVTFGFNLTNRQGEKLKSILDSGEKVSLHGVARGTGLEPYFMDVVVATITGSHNAEEELIFSAHLDHPKESANDNASGSAALLDIAHSLHNLIAEGRLPRPKRTLRFLWVPEWYGTMAYIDKHPEMVGPARGGKTFANFNLDMVGENLELLHSKLILTRVPDSVPSVLNDVIADMALMVDGMNIRTPRGSQSAFNYRITPYSGGSDHMMFIDRDIPGLMFTHSPDYTHHTSEDTPDKVDPVELERCEIIAAASALYLTNLDTEEALELSVLSGANAAARLGDAFKRAYSLLRKDDKMEAGKVWAEAVNIMDYALLNERGVLNSIVNFNGSELVQSSVANLSLGLNEQAKSYRGILASVAKRRGAIGKTPPPVITNVDDRVPMRKTRGPLTFDLPASKLSKTDGAWYSSDQFSLTGEERFELVNFIDGEMNATEIRNALSAQFRPIRQREVSRYLDDLVKVGVLEWK
tara:strand:- start:34242 stop:36293 length:2052 start_codon:yes stop_codon:yes gene_type:complete